MPVRLATTDDLDAIADMAMRFMVRTRYATILSPNRDDLKNTIVGILDQGRIWVAEIDGVVRGFLAAVIQVASVANAVVVHVHTFVNVRSLTV